MSHGAGAARMHTGAALLAVLLLGACASKKVCTPSGSLTSVTPPPDWREIVTDADHDKLRKLRESFLDGLAQARKAGFGVQVDAQGRLFNPDFAQEDVTPKPGAYHCRLFSLGTKIADRPAFIAEPVRSCSIADDGKIQQFGLNDGPQRLAGRIFPDEPSRGVFLGTRILPDEATALHYSRDADRDTVGALQRVGDARWRMAIPAPAWGAAIQVVEIVPAG